MEMALKEQVYTGIVRLVEASSFRRESLQLVAKQFPQVSEGALLSIYSQLVQLHTKRTHGHHRRPETMQQYFQGYLSAREREETSPDLLLNMAHKVTLSPALYARIILEQFAVCNSLVPPSASSPSGLVSQWVKNPLSIPDTALQLHVKTCILQDPNYGPLAENIKRSVGCEYEFLLREKVEALNIPFLEENGLRARGYDKTPDVKLEVPMAVDGHIVNWIESKASFGDRPSHERYLEDQFWSYRNRYGSGLVIYWFGFVEELNSFRDQGILLMEGFPDTSRITTLQTSLSVSQDPA